MRSYRPEELFDATGRLFPRLQALAPTGDRRMSANPHAKGGRLLRDLAMPDFHYAVPVDRPAVTSSEATQVFCAFLRDIIVRNPDQFRMMGPDETAANRLQPVFEKTNRAWGAEVLFGDDDLSPTVGVMEVLSEHLCQGWLERYLLTGRHGLFNCYEAFIHIVDSMFNEEGTTTTPFDMVMMNDLDRFHLVMDVIDRVPSLGSTAAILRQQMADARLAARGLHPRAWRGRPGDGRLDLAGQPRKHRRVGIRTE